jgi:hypothetical protein
LISLKFNFISNGIKGDTEGIESKYSMRGLEAAIASFDATAYKFPPKIEMVPVKSFS